MTYDEYIAYHLRGDAGVEERMIASLCGHYRLSAWDSFRLIYYYAMTYHIPSALDMLLKGERDIKRVKFRTDRRWVGFVPERFERMLRELSPLKLTALAAVRTTQQAYDVVCKWYYFSRYAAYLFLEVYCNVFKPGWADDLAPGWEHDELYTKGAVMVAKSEERAALDKFLARARIDTKDNTFAIETSLCAVAKFAKGTRYDGYYTERLLDDVRGTAYEQTIYRLL